MFSTLLRSPDKSIVPRFVELTDRNDVFAKLLKPRLTTVFSFFNSSQKMIRNVLIGRKWAGVSGQSCLYFKLIFGSNYVSSFKMLRGIIWIWILPESSSFLSWSKPNLKKKPYWANSVREWLFVTFLIFVFEVSSKKRLKLSKTLSNFYWRHFWKVLMVSVIFEFEICALKRLILLLLHRHSVEHVWKHQFIYFSPHSS